MTIPRILVIDDQYATQPDVSGNLCRKCGLVKIKTETSDDDLNKLAEAENAVAGVSFSSGQIKRSASVENSIDEALRAVRAGWPSNEGWRWALILLDIGFYSIPTQDDDSIFGLKILEELVRQWPDREAEGGNSELPIVMLTSFSRQEKANQANRAGAQDYVKKVELNRERLQELLNEYGLIGDPSGVIDLLR